MKPTLMCIKRYISEQNLLYLKQNQKNTNNYQTKYNNKCLFQKNHFKQKVKTQMYFTMPKTFNQLKDKLRKQKYSSKIKQEKAKTPIQNSLIEQRRNQPISHLKNSNQIIQQKNKLQENYQKDKRYVQWNIQEQVIVSQQISVNGSLKGSKIQENQQKQNDNPKDIWPLQSIKKVPTHLMKLGYSSIQSYLEQMKKINNIKDVKKKMVAYHCQSRGQNNLDCFNSIQKKLKNQKIEISKKMKKYEETVDIIQNFSYKYVKFIKQKFLSKSSNFSDKKKSILLQKSQQFKQQGRLIGDQNSQSLVVNDQIFSYQSITIVNCFNRRYFNYKIDSNTDIEQIFKYCTPLLQEKDKQNIGQVERQKQKQDKNNQIYFCCLNNFQLEMMQCFFWIGKPIMYYKRQQLIEGIGKFLNELKVQDLFQTQRIYIVDFNSRSCFVEKKNFKLKSRNQKQIKHLNKSSNMIRRSTRLSRSIQYLQQQNNNLQFLKLIQTIKQNNFNLAKVKKQKKIISKKGNFNFSTQPK